MLNITFTLFPLFSVVVLLLMNCSTIRSMLVGTVTGLIVLAIAPSTYSIAFNFTEYLHAVILDNFGTLLSIYVLNLLMYLITESTAIESLSNIMRHVIKTPRQIFSAIPLLGCLLSQDDYLSCMAGSTIITPIAESNGIKKEKIAFLVNITSVTLCCIFPISSWNPVIKSALTGNGFSEKLCLSTIPVNLTVILCIVTLFYFCCRSDATVHPSDHQRRVEPSISKKDYKNAICLFTIFFGLIAIYMYFSKIHTFIPTLTISGALVCVITICLFIHNQLLNQKQLPHIIKKAITSTTPLAMTLLSIWGFVTILNQYLGFGRMISTILKQFHITTIIIPMIIFAAAALFSFITGSAYGSFNLFISLAAVLSNEFSGDMKTLTVSAAISGSLFAAFSFSSDTTMLCHDKTNCNLQDLRTLQLSYALPLVITEIVSYLIFGAVAYNKYSIYSYLPVCIFLYVMLLMLQDIERLNKHPAIIYFQIYYSAKQRHNKYQYINYYDLSNELYFRRKHNNKPFNYRAKCPCK